jgi:cyanophycinase
MPSPELLPGTRGHIIPIGGAEDKVSGRVILKRFLDLCGNKEARIAVIPTASQMADTGSRYKEIFKNLGARKVDVLPFAVRADAEREDWLEALGEADGIFMTGGSQLRLSTILGGTSVASTIRRRNARGVPVAGTSAGAAFVSEHMIAYGKEGATPIAGQVTLAPGLGLSNRIIVDQHFRERDRIGRLMTALAYNPFAVGVGLDEDTAAFINRENKLEVVGSGAITIVDVSALEYSSMAQVEEGKPVTLIGVRLHVLAHGSTYDMEARRATPGALAGD